MLYSTQRMAGAMTNSKSWPLLSLAASAIIAISLADASDGCIKLHVDVVEHPSYGRNDGNQKCQSPVIAFGYFSNLLCSEGRITRAQCRENNTGKGGSSQQTGVFRQFRGGMAFWEVLHGEKRNWFCGRLKTLGVGA